MRNELEAAIARSQDHLLDLQKPEGYWVGELMVDSTLVSDMVAYHHWDGKVDEKWQRKAVNHLFSMQLPDGGWNLYYGGPSEVNATVKGYLALKLAGVPATDPRMLKAREMALILGGLPRMNPSCLGKSSIDWLRRRWIISSASSVPAPMWFRSSIPGPARSIRRVSSVGACSRRWT